VRTFPKMSSRRRRPVKSRRHDVLLLLQYISDRFRQSGRNSPNAFIYYQLSTPVLSFGVLKSVRRD
jgi:hypothetical protein